MGRLLAFRLSEQGAKVTLFDRDTRSGSHSCGYVGAGMLAPVSELESAEPLIARLGFDSLPLWERLLNRLETPVFYRRLGTLIVAHHLDTPELVRFSRLLQHKIDALPAHVLPPKTRPDIRWKLTRTDLRNLEPQIGERFQQGVYIPGEGQIDNRQLMVALEQGILSHQADWQEGVEIQQVISHQIVPKNLITPLKFDWVIDCRGLGAQPDWNAVRGVRGEIIRVHAPEVSLSRPVRLMHPRYPLYIAPRENNHYLIGATSIESQDFRPITMQSALELLSAAFTAHPGFAEASILEMQVNCRPALPDNLPQIRVTDGLIQINGLYRHGFLISPQMTELVVDYLATGTVPSHYASLFSEQTEDSYQKKPSEVTDYAIAN